MARWWQGWLTPVRTLLPTSYEYDYLESLRTTRRFIFVTGMHRSGTTFLAQKIGNLPGISGFRGIPGTMDEGQFVQRVFPIDAVFGGMGGFGYHPRSRMIEPSAARASEIGVCLLKDWLTYLDRDAAIFLEKTPSNFRRCRLLAAAFPHSHFIHLIRHPAATVLALQSFAPRSRGVKGRSFSALLRHWTHCQQQAIRDYEWLRSQGKPVMLLALEDLPLWLPELHRVLERWMGTTFDAAVLRQGMDNTPNEKYLQSFANLQPSERKPSRSTRALLDELGYSMDDLSRPPDYVEWFNPGLTAEESLHGSCA